MFRFSDFRFSVILSNQSSPFLCLQFQPWQTISSPVQVSTWHSVGWTAIGNKLCLHRSCWSTAQFEHVEGLSNIWLENAAAKTLQASRMNLWTDIWKPFPACPSSLWLQNNLSFLGTPSFRNNCPECLKALRVHILAHTAGQHKPALWQEPPCHWHRHSWVSTQLLPQLASQPAQSLGWGLPTLLHINLHTKSQHESKLHPNEPIWLQDMGPVPEILFCRLPQSHGSLALCREDKLLHFPIGSRKCTHHRCPQGRSYKERRAQLSVMKETLWGVHPHPHSAADDWEWEIWEMGEHSSS